MSYCNDDANGHSNPLERSTALDSCDGLSVACADKGGHIACGSLDRVASGTLWLRCVRIDVLVMSNLHPSIFIGFTILYLVANQSIISIMSTDNGKILK